LLQALGQVVIELGLDSWSSALSVAQNSLPKDAAVTVLSDQDPVNLQIQSLSRPLILLEEKNSTK